jgi:hypothetical protein
MRIFSDFDLDFSIGNWQLAIGNTLCLGVLVVRKIRENPGVSF